MIGSVQNSNKYRVIIGVAKSGEEGKLKGKTSQCTGLCGAPNTICSIRVFSCLFFLFWETVSFLYY